MARHDQDQLTALRRTRYLGSHPRSSGQIDNVDIIFTKEVVRFRPKRSSSAPIELRWGDVERLDSDDAEKISKDVSTSSILLLGPLAYFAGEKRVESYLVIADADGEWIFAVPDLSKVELRAGLGPLQEFVSKRSSTLVSGQQDQPLTAWTGDSLNGEAPQDTTTDLKDEPESDWQTQSPADRLREITKLHRSGLITDAEFESKRVELIEEL